MVRDENGHLTPVLPLNLPRSNNVASWLLRHYCRSEMFAGSHFCPKILWSQIFWSREKKALKPKHIIYFSGTLTVFEVFLNSFTHVDDILLWLVHCRMYVTLGSSDCWQICRAGPLDRSCFDQLIWCFITWKGVVGLESACIEIQNSAFIEVESQLTAS